MVEQRSPKPQVAGSSPVSPARKCIYVSYDTYLKIEKMNSILLYVKESYNELVHNVTWPTIPELIANSRLVLVGSIIFALIVFVLDLISKGLLDFVY